MDFHFWFC